jgi:transposase-like protein
MSKDTSRLQVLHTSGVESRGLVYDGLEQFARAKMQELLRMVLEEEVEAFLGRAKSERRDEDAPEGYRNGYGKERRFSTSIGTVTVRRPRVRDAEEKFISQVLPLFRRQSKEVRALLPELYLHGLAQGDFELAMRGLLGEGAPLSASSIARLKEVWKAEYAAWGQRRLDELEVVYLWVDGIYVKAGLEKDKAALLVGVAGLSDGSKVIIEVASGQRESVETWAAILRSLKARGMNCPRLVIGDGSLGMWGALRQVYPEAEEQRCWKHRMGNVLDRVSKKKQGVAKELLQATMYAPTEKEAVKRKQEFQNWAREQQFAKAADLLDDDWERMVAYYAFPKEHWIHLRTTNPVESPFSSVRLRTTAAKRFKKVDAATAMIWKLLMVAQQSFRKLNEPELLPRVHQGMICQDGIPITKPNNQNRSAKRLAA